jgi:hypothetical protein
MAAGSESWVKGLGQKEGDVYVSGVVTDSHNNAIIAGSFNAAQLELSESITLQNNGISDIFLVKYDPRGEIIWATSFGGTDEDQASDIFVDRENNLYITGNFRSPSFTVGSTEIGSMWPDNVYVAKFDQNGNLQWLKHSTLVTQRAISQGVYCDEHMNVYFTGYTQSKDISFGDIHLQSNNTNNKGFFCRLDQEGNFEMAGLLDDPEDGRYVINDITADGQGNIYLAGKKTIHTEPDPVTWIEYRDVMFFSKTDPAGTLSWTVEDTAFHRAEKIGYDQGSLYVLGSREEWRFIFNGGTIDTTSRCYYGSFDLSGTLLWDRSFTGALAYDLFVGEQTILLTGGLLTDQLELGEFQITRNSDSSSICPIYQDIFYLESSKSGTLKNLESISGSLEDIPTGIWLADNGDLLFSGTFESASLPVVQSEVYNNSELTVFQHVSGIYYDRRIYSFMARHFAYAGPSGMDDRAQDPILVYPNPSDGVFTINSLNIQDAVRIQVHDMRGRPVYLGDSFQTPFQVDLRDQPEGMYILSFTGKKGSVRKSRLIIK